MLNYILSTEYYSKSTNKSYQVVNVLERKRIDKKLYFSVVMLDNNNEDKQTVMIHYNKEIGNWIFYDDVGNIYKQNYARMKRD